MMNPLASTQPAGNQPAVRPPAESRPVVAAFRNVSKNFDSFWGGNLARALANVSFEVRQGEVFGLLGPAGSGKSSILNLLAGRLAAMEGRVEVFGRSPRRRAVVARVGYVSQRPDRPYGVDTTARRGVFDWLFRPKSARGAGRPSPVTTGNVRSALAQALLKNPALLLLDDPFAGLDPGLSRDLHALIRSLVREGQTIVLASRSWCDLKDLCDRVAILSGGRIEAVGTAAELLAAPDAVRVLAPVLPAALLAKLRDLIQLELSAVAESPAACRTSPRDVPSVPSQPGSSTEDHTTALADQILARLLKAPDADLPPVAAISQRPV